jgi:hypothetical protein
VAEQAELAERLTKLERHVGRHDRELKAVIAAIRALIRPTARLAERRIGFGPHK